MNGGLTDAAPAVVRKYWVVAAWLRYRNHTLCSKIGCPRECVGVEMVLLLGLCPCARQWIDVRWICEIDGDISTYLYLFAVFRFTTRASLHHCHVDWLPRVLGVGRVWCTNLLEM